MIKVAILMGGPSTEYHVSLNSGKNVINNLRPDKYLPLPVVIDKNLKWHFITLRKILNEKEAIVFLKKVCDVVFLALHGSYGEDGKIQKLLEKNKIKFTGSDSKASKIGIDKMKTYKILKKENISFPPTWTFKSFYKIFKKKKIKFPIVVKPNDQGSSVGVSIIKNPTEKSLIKAVNKAKKFSKKVLIQKFIDGYEITCGVFHRIALLPTLIVPQEREFFDYYSKYTAGATQEITPAPLEKSLLRQVRKIALKVHRAVGCRHFSRTDMILGKDKNIYVLEINTIPGMTKTSLLPQQLMACGIKFSEFLDKIIKLALK